MTLEQKIEHLKDAAMQEARAEGNAIMKQHEDALEGVFEQHKAEALRQSETVSYTHLTLPTILLV
mgnify:CR=1 FL=1